MDINVYYWNNGVGVVSDSILIKNVLSKFNTSVYDVSKTNIYKNSDVGIFIQNIWLDYLNHNRKNVYIINDEWLNPDEIRYLDKFDCIIVKSEYTKKLLSPYHKNVICTGFFSLDRYFFPRCTEKILHFKGKSIQKNTELVKNYPYINIIDSKQSYITENDVVYNLNNHDIHICCSLYEGWGHYLWEAMSCGKLVICSEVPVFKEYLNPDLVKFIPTKNVYSYNKNYEFLNTKNYKFRKGYVVDETKFEEVINNKEELFDYQKKNKELIRDYFLYINNKNKENFLNFFKFI